MPVLIIFIDDRLVFEVVGAVLPVCSVELNQITLYLDANFVVGMVVRTVEENIFANKVDIITSDKVVN